MHISQLRFSQKWKTEWAYLRLQHPRPSKIFQDYEDYSHFTCTVVSWHSGALQRYTPTGSLPRSKPVRSSSHGQALRVRSHRRRWFWSWPWPQSLQDAIQQEITLSVLSWSMLMAPDDPDGWSWLLWLLVSKKNAWPEMSSMYAIKTWQILLARPVSVGRAGAKMLSVSLSRPSFSLSKLSCSCSYRKVIEMKFGQKWSKQFLRLRTAASATDSSWSRRSMTIKRQKGRT